MARHTGPEIEAFCDDVAALTDLIRPVLAGHPSAIQSGALANCLAMWLAGHVCVGDPEGTDELREILLDNVVVIVRALIEPNAIRFVGAAQKPSGF